MSRSATLCAVVWVAAMACGLRGVWAQETSAGSLASSGSRVSASVQQRPPSSTYYAFKSPAEAHQAPDPSAPVVFTITSESQPLRALGMVSSSDADGPGPVDPAAPDRRWIKLRSASGTIGFVMLSQLITPQQLEAKKQSSRKLGMLEAELAAMKRSNAAEIPAGIYTLGGSCDAGFSSHGDTIAFLGNKVLVWQEADKLHFVHVLDPLAPVVYDILNDTRTVELQGFGYVQMKTFRSEQDSALMGFKNKFLWFTASGTQFDSYQLCDTATQDTVLSLLKTYAGQRPPE